MPFTRGILYTVLALQVLLVPAVATAQVVAEEPAEEPAEVPQVIPIEVDADRLEYDASEQVLSAVGNVVVRHGNAVVRADRADVFRETQVVKATGNVVFERDGDRWEGPQLTYDFLNEAGDFGRFKAFTDPFYVTAQGAQHVSGNRINLDDVILTTCEGPKPEFRIKAKSASIMNGETVRAKSVVFFVGPVPVFYLPYVKRDLQSTGLDIVPGYGSQMGAFLLTAYNYPINDYVSAATHLDFRTKRGVGVGQDVLWEDPEGTFGGELSLYYTHDRKPFEDDAEEALLGDLIDENRGRVKFSHFQAINERAYVLADIEWLSDPDVLEDFFDKEFRYESQPENRVSLTHRGDIYTATFLVDGKLNDFFDSVNRFPEVTFDINRFELQDTGIFYEGQHQAGYYERDFADSVPTNETPRVDYDSFRFDSANRILYPTRHFGFLNLIPRGSYRATYYSKTRETFTVTEEVTTVDELGVPVTTVEEVEEEREGNADVRNVFELGLEGSFKAFKVFHERPLWSTFEGLRHVAEPFGDYTYIPEPNLLPRNVYQFDSVDGIEDRNDVRFGIRNKFQTRRKGLYAHNLMEGDIYTIYSLDANPGDSDFSPLFADFELRPLEAFALDFDLSYDFETSTLETFNSQLAFLARDSSRVSAEYRYQESSRELVTGELDLFPRSKWSLSTYWRYSLETSSLQEHEYVIRTKSQCLGFGLGYREVAQEGPDDRQIWGLIWLLAFPESVISIGR